MFRYPCHVCNTIVTYGEWHSCYFPENDAIVYSLAERRDRKQRRVDEATKKCPENLRADFRDQYGVAKKDNADESEKLNRSLVERGGHLVNSSNNLISGPLPNVPSFSPHSRDNQTTYIWNPYEGFKPVCRSQGDIRGASQRVSRPKKIVYGKKEGIGCDFISFRKETSKTCKTSRDESGSNASINAKSCSSSNTKSHGKEAHSNSSYTCQTPNLFPCVAFSQCIEKSKDVMTGHLHNPLGLPISTELPLQGRYSSALSITNAEQLHNSMENSNLISGSSSTHRDPAKKRYPCDECDKSFGRKWNLEKHYRTHTGEKPFVCDVCQKKFSQKENLKIHHRIHTGKKPFLCIVCKKAFTQKASLERHRIKHDGE